MEGSRIESLQKLAESRPHDPRARFGLALEYERAGRFLEAIEQLQSYLSLADDEGNAYGRLARGFLELGREDEARDAYRQGIAAASRHGHPTMVMEYEEALEEF